MASSKLLASLSAQNFNAEEFVRLLVQNNSIENVKQQLLVLTNGKTSLAGDMQRSVHTHYHDFISISQEIQQLERELSELRDLFYKMKMDVLVREDLSSLPRISIKSPEVVDVELDDVEGMGELQNGRQLLFQSAALHLNPEDGQLGKQSHLFLFNDLVVLVYKKKRAVRSKLYVEKVLNLIEIFPDDDTQDTSFKLTFSTSGEYYSLRVDSPELKQEWIRVLKKASQDLVKQSSERNTISLPSPSAVTSVNDLVHSGTQHSRFYKTVHLPQENSNPDLAWIRDMPDELDVYIAHREFDKAIQCVDRARGVFNNYGLNSTVLLILNRQFEMRVNTLATILTRDLHNPNLPSSATALCITRLSRLGLATRARDLFFQTRSRIIRARLLNLPFEGDTIAYIHDLTYLFFSLIKKIIRQYKQYFPSAALSSGLVAWLHEELEMYWQRFRCQVFHEDQDFGIITECLNSAREGCSVLREVGVELGHVFEIGAVRRDVVTSLEWLRARVCADMAKAMADDEFLQIGSSDRISLNLANGQELTIPNKKASESVLQFQRMLLQFLFVDVRPLLLTQSSHSYYTELTSAVSSFFELYFRHILDVSHDTHITDRSALVTMQNLYYLAHELFPLIKTVLEQNVRVPQMFLADRQVDVTRKSSVKNQDVIGFARSIPEWQKLAKRLEAMVTVRFSTYAIKRAKELAKSTYAFGPTCVDKKVHVSFLDYSSDAYPLVENLVPNESIIACLKELSRLEKIIEELCEEYCQEEKLLCEKKTVMMAILECFFNDLSDEKNWTTQHGYDRVFQYTGLHQFILDIHFFLKLADAYLAPSATKLATDACSKALKLYFKRCTDEQKKRVLKSGEWYDKRVNEIAKKGGSEWRLGKKKKSAKQ